MRRCQIEYPDDVDNLRISLFFFQDYFAMANQPCQDSGAGPQRQMQTLSLTENKINQRVGGLQ
jgi:hypothetical protein